MTNKVTKAFHTRLQHLLHVVCEIDSLDQLFYVCATGQHLRTLSYNANTYVCFSLVAMSICVPLLCLKALQNAGCQECFRQQISQTYISNAPRFIQFTHITKDTRHCNTTLRLSLKTAASLKYQTIAYLCIINIYV